MRIPTRPLLAASILGISGVSAVLAASCTGAIGPAGESHDSGTPSSPKGSDTGTTGRIDATGDAGMVGKQPGTDAALPPFDPVSTASAVSKVKNLLIGAPATESEVQQVDTGLKNGGAAGASAAMKALIVGWTASPPGQGHANLTPATLSPYQAKLLSFLATAFQQTQVTTDNFRALNDMFGGFALGELQNELLTEFQQMFALTVLQLLANGQSFADAITTQQFMMTPAMSLVYAFVDSQVTDDSGQTNDLTLTQATAQGEEFGYTLTGNGSIADYPIEQALDASPGNPNYMTFYNPGLVAGNLPTNQVLTTDQWNQCLAAAPWHFTAKTTTMRSVTEALAFLLFGDAQSSQFKLFADGADAGGSFFLCNPGPANTSMATFQSGGTYLQPSDFSTWNLVTIRQPGPTETATRFYDLPKLRSPTAPLLLHTPRVGYFTTQSFFAGWATNASNQARVTMNQTMIVGLNQPFGGNDNVDLSTINMQALDGVHAAPGSACFGCHQTLDPMRQFFRQAYSLDFSVQTDAGETAMPGQFAFQGETQGGNNTLTDLAYLIRGHKLFPSAWVQKLCTYATSSQCDENDPEFQRLVNVFQTSNYDLHGLVLELFSSPIVTYLTETVTAEQDGGMTFPITRQGHLCALLSERLNIADVCGLLPTTTISGNFYTVQSIASGLPSDEYSRGSKLPVLANDPSLFYRAGLENICSALANAIIDNPASDAGWSSTNPDAAINQFVSNLMGLTPDRMGTPDSGPLAILQSHFARAKAAAWDGGKSNASDALKSTFVLACESPYVAGIGQ